MSFRTSFSLRILGWAAAAVATACIWAGSPEKPVGPPLPKDVVLIRDLHYRSFRESQGELESPMKLDLYLPSDDGISTERSGGLRPAIVAVHGGSWAGGSKREYGPQFARFAERGIVVAVVDYQLARPGAPSWPAAFQDVAAAVEWLSIHAENYRIDADRLAVIGTSAGGLLAAHIALGTSLEGNRQATNRSVRAAVCLSSPMDLSQLASSRSLTHDPVHEFTGSSSSESFASPAVHIVTSSRPMLLIHGTDDGWVPINQAREMHMRLDGLAIPNRLIEIDGARHGFELRVGGPVPRDLLPDIFDFLNDAWREREEDAA